MGVQAICIPIAEFTLNAHVVGINGYFIIVYADAVGIDGYCGVAYAHGCIVLWKEGYRDGPTTDANGVRFLRFLS